MAEQVQSILERMVPPLKDLRDRGLFSPDEVRAIVDRRRRSEYLLQRRSGARRQDYLRYIEDEILLERLRKLRKERVLTELRNERMARREDGDDDDEKRHAYQTSGIGDSHIVSHIHFLYQRTLRKFHHPLDVLLNYAEFAKEHKSFQTLGKIYAEGLQRHPREAGLWIEAASFEYFGYVAQDYEKGDDVSSKVVGGSIRNARVLLQRGLRVNKTSPELWLQYFALELHYVQKLRGRREILELGLHEEDGGASSDEEEGGDDDKEGEGKDDEGEKIAASLLPAQIIFQNAIKAVSGDVRFRLRFVEACRMFPQTKKLEECVMESVTRDFGQSVEAWVARISYAEEEGRRQFDKKGRGGKVGFLADAADKENEEDHGSEEEGDGRPAKRARMESSEKDPALSLLHEALDAVPTAKMYLEGSRFVRLRIQRLLDEDQGMETEEGDGGVSHLIQKGEDASEAARRHAHLLEEIHERAGSKGVSSTALTLDNVDFLLSTGQPEKAEQLLKDACASAGDADARLWLRWAEITHRMQAGDVASSSTPVRILRRALKHTPMSHRQGHELISTELMRHLMMQPPSKKTSEELKSLFEELLLLSQGTAYSLSNVKKSTDDREDEESGVEQVNVAAIFLAYLKYTILNDGGDTSGNNAVRSIYTSVLYSSNFGKSCSGRTEEELHSMKSFFDLCIEFERTSSPTGTPSLSKKERKERKKKGKMRLCKLYEAAFLFYESGGGAWRKAVGNYQRALNDVKHSM